MMNHTLAIVVLMIASSTLAMGQSTQQVSTIDQQTDAQRAAKAELNEAARAYKAGEFAEAQRHSERALQLDPSSKVAPTFIARAIHSQFRMGDESTENVAIAREAITAYEKLLLINPEDEESFKAILELYDAIGENELQYSWILRRAVNAAVSDTKRAEAYVILASKDWNCSYTITERPDSKRITDKKRGDAIIVYRAPKDQREFDKALQCVRRGLDMVESAISLNTEDAIAWSFKTNLLLEWAKLSEMEGDKNRADDYRKQANEAQTRTTELPDKQQQDTKHVELENRDTIDQSTAAVVMGTVLVGKAISKPLPPYPPQAKSERAHGTVVVEVMIDEEGKVIKAKAVSGDKRLRAAAERAAMQARFSPTILSGRPVKVTGVIKYNFSLDGDAPGFEN